MGESPVPSLPVSLLLFQLLQQLPEILTLAQGPQVVVLFEMVAVLISLGDGIPEYGHRLVAVKADHGLAFSHDAG
jgi:hypothetical protein